MTRSTAMRVGLALVLVACATKTVVDAADGGGGESDATDAGGGERDGTVVDRDGNVGAADATPADAPVDAAPPGEFMITCGDGGLALDPTFGDGGVAEGVAFNASQITQIYPQLVVQRPDGTYVVAANDIWGNARSTLYYDASGKLVDAVHPPVHPFGASSRCWPAFGHYDVTESGRVAGFGFSQAMLTDGGDAGAGFYSWLDTNRPIADAFTKIAELPDRSSVVTGASVDGGWCGTTRRYDGDVFVGLLDATGTLTWRTMIHRMGFFVPVRPSQVEVRDGLITVLVEGRGVARLDMAGNLRWIAGRRTADPQISIVALDNGRVATADGTFLEDGGRELSWDASAGPPRFVDDAGSVYFGSPPGLLHRRFADGGEDPTYASAPLTRINMTEGGVWKGCTVTKANGAFFRDAGTLNRYRY